MHLDAAIIGGGPAGAVAALSLRQLIPAAEIGIFDSGTRAAYRPAEILSPGAIPILESLGCADAFRQSGPIESFGTSAAWGSPEIQHSEFIFGLRGNGWRLNRTSFDRLLLDQACQNRVRYFPGHTLLDSELHDDLWRLRFRGSECSARFVIDASGRTAAFAIQREARRLPDDRLVGVCVLMEARFAGDTLIEATENGWWYSASISSSTAVAAFMTDSDLIRDSQIYRSAEWLHALGKTTHMRDRLCDATAQGAPAVYAAQSQRLSKIAGRGWVAAGDAAMAFDPLSSQGILKALRTGKLASFVAADYLLRGKDSHQRYEKLADAEYAAYQKAKGEYYGMENRWPEATFWRRRRT